MQDAVLSMIVITHLGQLRLEDQTSDDALAVALAETWSTSIINTTGYI